MKTRSLTKNNVNEFHEKLTQQLSKFVNEFQELEVTPFINFEDETKKGFGILTDNGDGSKMKKFRVTVEKYK